MLTMIYQGILLFFIVLFVRAVFREKKKSMQLTAAVACIPFILRLLMIK